MKAAPAVRPAATHRGAIAPFAGVALALMLGACQDAGRATAPARNGPDFTLGSGSQSMLLGRATFPGPFKVKRETGEWELELEASGATDVAVQSITFAPGGHSGWHKHPGAVFIQVVEGTMTFYDSNDPACAPTVRTVGQGFLDTGEHAHIARNETDSPARNVVTYFAPPGAALRIDAPAPGNCPF